VLLLLISVEDVSEIFLWRVVHPLAPEDPRHHLAVVDLPVLEKHASVQFQGALEEVARVDLVLGADDAQSPWPPLLVDEPQVGRVAAALHLLDHCKLREVLTIYHVSVEQ
jgi:hypothetical protein